MIDLPLPGLFETLIQSDDGSVPRAAHEEEQKMVAVLQEAGGTTEAQTAKKYKVSEPTIYAWRKHFGLLDVADVKRLKTMELKLKNSRLMKFLAEAALDNAILKGINARECAWHRAQCSARPAPPLTLPRTGVE